jgi:hypothetical protein
MHWSDRDNFDFDALILTQRYRRRGRPMSLYRIYDQGEIARFAGDAMGRATRERHHRRCNKTDGVPHATAK